MNKPDIVYLFLLHAKNAAVSISIDDADCLSKCNIFVIEILHDYAMILW